MIEAEALLPTYRRLPVCFERGEGVWLYDTEGLPYLDCLAGLACCVLGHSHPALVAAIHQQAARLLQVSNLFYTPPGIAAAKALAERLGPGRVFFCNSGAEANEAAIKLARKAAWRRGEPERVEIVAFDGSFHGRTLGTLPATISPPKWVGFGPLPPGYVGVPKDPAVLERVVTERTAAVILETIQGEGGVWPLPDELVREARRITAERGALLVVDEVQTGVGRTGRWWGFEHHGIRPDVVTMAKGLGGGVAVGAMWVEEGLAEALQPGDHGTTFGGNPLAAAAVIATLETVEAEGLVGRAAEVGEALRAALEPLGESVRGRGMLLALELGRPVAAEVVRAALERGLVVNDVTPSAIRLAPPLVMTADEAAEAAARLGDAIGAVG